MTNSSEAKKQKMMIVASTLLEVYEIVKSLVDENDPNRVATLDLIKEAVRVYEYRARKGG